MSNFNEKRQSEDMSMEDILASIRKYVSDEEGKTTSSSEENQVEEHDDLPIPAENVIKLSESNVISEERQPTIKLHARNENYNPDTYEEKSTLAMEVDTPHVVKKQSGGPFDKLADALKSYGKPKEKVTKQAGISDITLEQFLSEIAARVIEDWAEKNLRKISEEIVVREIEKIKSE